MKKRFLGMVTAGILTAVMLAGCGASTSKVTAESLLQEVKSKCDAMKSLETHTTAEITLGLRSPWRNHGFDHGHDHADNHRAGC